MSGDSQADPEAPESPPTVLHSSDDSSEDEYENESDDADESSETDEEISVHTDLDSSLGGSIHKGGKQKQRGTRDPKVDKKKKKTNISKLWVVQPIPGRAVEGCRGL